MGECSEMNPENEVLLQNYLKSRDLSQNTTETYSRAILSFDVAMGMPLADAGAAEVKEWLEAVREKKLKPSTIHKYADNLRRLLRFALTERGLEDEDAELQAKKAFKPMPIKDLRRRARKQNVLRDKIVSNGEFQLLLEAASHPRQKALLAVLHETGCRKGEVLSLRLRDIKEHETPDHKIYWELNVVGKTGERTLTIVRSVPYLMDWLNAHPDRRPEQYIFATRFKGRVGKMSEDSVNTMFSSLCKKAGTRHIHPHMLRHTRLTLWAGNPGISEAQLKNMAGWTQSTKMLERYIHLSGRNHVAALLKSQGLEVKAEAREKPEPFIELSECPKCRRDVAPGQVFCPYCGFILDGEMARSRSVEHQNLTAQVRLLAETANELFASLNAMRRERGDFDDLGSVRINPPRDPEAMREALRQMEREAESDPYVKRVLEEWGPLFDSSLAAAKRGGPVTFKQKREKEDR